MAGVKGRSGRKRNPRNATRYFTELYDDNSYELAKTTIDKALSGDRELLIYCHDRRLGKPKQQTELTGGEKLGSGVMVEVFKAIAEERRRLVGIKQIAGGDNATEQDEDETPGSRVSP